MNFSAGIGLILMRPRHAALVYLFGALSSTELPGAELLPEPVTRDVKSESLRLIQQDIRVRKGTEPVKPTLSSPATTSEEVLDLPDMVVREKKTPQLPSPPPKEPKLQEFFRTGTIWENRSGSVKLWIKGDKGLMLTIPF